MWFGPAPDPAERMAAVLAEAIHADTASGSALGLTSRRALLLLILTLAALGALTPWSLALTAPVIALTLIRTRQWDGVTLGGTLLLAGSLLSLLVTVDLPASVAALAGIFGAFAVSVLFIQWWNSVRRLWAGVAVYIAIACALVVLATIQVDIAYAKLNGMSQAVYQWFSRWPHLDNVGFSQNATAALIVAVTPFAVACVVAGRAWYSRAAAALATLWLIFALVLTLSRGAFFGLAFGLGAMIWLNGGRTRWLAPLPTVVTLALLLAGVTGYEFTISSTPTGWSSVDRFYIWHTALRMLADFPLTGPGVGTFAARIAAYTWPMEARDIPHAHNFVLQTYLDSGLLGLIGMVTLVLGAGYGALRLLRARLPRPLRALTIAAAGALVGTLAHGSVDAYFWGDPRTFYVVAIPLAVLFSIARLQRVSLAFPDSPHLAARLAGWREAAYDRLDALGRPRATLAGIAALTLLLIGLRPLASLTLMNTGNVLREHGELMPTGSTTQAITLALAAVQLHWSANLEPRYGAAWQDLADVYLDERDTAAASLYLARAAREGQNDALVQRDDDRLSRLAVALAGGNPRAAH